MTVKADKGAKALLKLDKTFQKLMEDSAVRLVAILVGKPNARGKTDGNTIILNNFKRRWQSQRKFEPLTQETENRKTDRSEDFMLVSEGELMRSVRDKTSTRMSGDRIIVEAEVPDYGVFIQEGTGKMPPRPFFSIKGFEKLVFDLFENLLVLQLKRVGIKSKEI